MPNKCLEVSGVLFKHTCTLDAVTQCTRCRKPICKTHTRGSGYQTACISCLRDFAKNPPHRTNMAFLRDDPYFFWYYGGADWFSDPYGAEDYALFDPQERDFRADFDAGAESDWAGS